MQKVKIDAKDREILHELEIDCRRSLTSLAKKLKLSVPALSYRIKRLKKNGVIIGFFTFVDYSLFGMMNFDVWFELSHKNPEEKKKFIEHLEKNPDIVWLVECSGRFDCAIAIIAPDVVSFNEKLHKLTVGFEDVIQNRYVTVAGRQWNPARHYLHGKHHETHERRTLSGTRKRITLGVLEKGILRLLVNDARLPVIEIAKKLKASPITIRSKLKKLEKEVILGYRAPIQSAAIGYQNYEVLISTNNLNEEKENQIINYCKSNPYFTILLLTIGAWDVNFAFDAESNEQAQNVVNAFRSQFGQVIKSYEIINTIKVRKYMSTPETIE